MLLNRHPEDSVRPAKSRDNLESHTHALAHRHGVGQNVQLDVLPVVRDEHGQREEEYGADYVELKRRSEKTRRDIS